MKTREDNYIFTIVDFDNLNREEYYSFKKKAIFTTFDWINFIREDSHVTPLIIRIVDKDLQFVGYFTSMISYKFGLKIIGSPFSGWSTCWMGFDVVDGVNKDDLIRPVVHFLLNSQNASFVQIIDRDFSVEMALQNGFNFSTCNSLELQINRTDEELFKVFKTDCRNFIRQFERRGATLEQVPPSMEFATEYYEQLKDVFAKQGMVPTYSEEKVKCMMRHLSSGENILCQRVVDPDGNCIATSIFLGYNKKMFFWGGASYRSGQHFRPNEYMIWSAIKYWRDKGFEVFDMVGDRSYKRKFGPVAISYACIEFARIPILIKIKRLAGNLYFMLLNIKGRLKGKK